MIQPIELKCAKHRIEDEYEGFSYEVDQSFRPAKSHAGEIGLLAVYAPNGEYGIEGDTPCIALQEDDEVYCAIDEFRERGTFEGAMELVPLSGRFLFKAKRAYYDCLMYFYGFEREEGCWMQAGLCLVYPKEYAGTEDEKKLMDVLDEAAKSFKDYTKTGTGEKRKTGGIDFEQQ